MKNLLVVLLSAIVFVNSGCRECKQESEGTFCFQNGTTSNISVTVEGYSAFTVYATGSRCYSFPEGRHEYSARTTDFPASSTWYGSINVEQCKEGSIELIR